MSAASKSYLESLISTTDFESVPFTKPERFLHKHVAYGTAGFRTKAVDLDWVLYRMGLLASLRSVSLKGDMIGCMITASHNPAEDNGCKLIDPMGDMLAEDWEKLATELVNTNDIKETLLQWLKKDEFTKFVADFDASEPESRQICVAAAHDTRDSCPLLLDAFRTGCAKLECSLNNFGLLGTPQLHYIVRCVNSKGAYGKPDEQGYFAKLTQAFFNIWSLLEFKSEKDDEKYECELFVDGANGVGAGKVELLAKYFKENSESSDSNNNVDALSYQSRNKSRMSKSPSNSTSLKMSVFNTGKNKSKDLLNHQCGADFVKVQQRAAHNLPANPEQVARKYCSFDGDADRIVYYFVDKEDGKFSLLDGDKIATLVATHLKELLDGAQLGGSECVQLCIVQTAYANGSSTNFIKDEMKLEQACVPTGVKHLHHEAQKKDLAVYFEANGHGTILFSEKTEKLIEDRYAQLVKDSKEQSSSDDLSAWLKSDKTRNALYQLKHFKDLVNQTVGDAISDMLVVEICLASRHMSTSSWSSVYTDLPSRQLKVKIADRTQIKTEDAERKVCQPKELQTAIDKLLAESIPSEELTKMYRAFVRPSGTEDVVRVYAEADTQANVDRLAMRVSQLVFDLAGGVGERP